MIDRLTLFVEYYFWNVKNPKTHGESNGQLREYFVFIMFRKFVFLLVPGDLPGIRFFADAV